MEQLLIAEVETGELRRPACRKESPAHRVLDGGWLLEDLLQHEVLEPAPLDLAEVPVDLAHRPRHLVRVEIDDAVAAAIDHREIPVIQVDDLSGVLEDR